MPTGYRVRSYLNALKKGSRSATFRSKITGSTAAGDYGFSAATYAKGKTYVHIFQHYGSDGTAWNDMQYPTGFGIMDHTTGEF